MSLFRPLHHTFAPLADRTYVGRAFRLLFARSSYQSGPGAQALRDELGRRFQADASLFASGRESLLALLRALGIGPGDEVIVQAYTCIVVPNAIRATGATAIFSDVDPDTLNLDPEETEKMVTPRTKAVICQHTFGIPAPLSELKELCERHNIPLIEDCAHVLPDDTGPIGIARTGRFAFCSFGRDKAISGISGGAVLSRDATVTKTLQSLEWSAAPLPRGVTARLLLYPLLYWLARPLYGLLIGKAFLAVCARLSLLVPIVTAGEKHGFQQGGLRQLPDGLARLALSQLRELRALNDRRRAIAALYLAEAKARQWPVVAGAVEGLPLQKFPLFVQDAEHIRNALKKRNIHLHDGWTGCVICPANADASDVGYTAGSGPGAEQVAVSILSLPTHPTMTIGDAERIIQALNPLPR